VKHDKQRADKRVRITLKAQVRIAESARLQNVPGPWHPCLIEDFSSNGFRLFSALNAQVADVLELSCELYPERVFNCKIEARHVTDEWIGTKIVEVSNYAMRMCQQFIDEKVYLK
jgi:ArsR family metal-binding transcriptional regulator